MSESILEVATVVGASVGVDVYEVSLHPSGAWMLFTTEGKKYLEVVMDIAREDLTVAVLAVLRPVVAVEETSEDAEVFAEAGSVEEEIFTTDVPPASKPAKAPKGKKPKVVAVDELTGVLPEPKVDE